MLMDGKILRRMHTQKKNYYTHFSNFPMVFPLTTPLNVSLLDLTQLPFKAHFSIGLPRSVPSFLATWLQLMAKPCVEAATLQSTSRRSTCSAPGVPPMNWFSDSSEQPTSQMRLRPSHCCLICSTS